MLISEDEARSTVELKDMYVVQPAVSPWFGYEWENMGSHLKDGFRYASNTNEDWLNMAQIKEIVAPFEQEFLNGTLA